jgi:para-nitrobenzyl esterase
VSTEPVVKTRHGDVRGRSTAAGPLVFLGIPYAAPPVGADRFQPPRPPEPWTHTREATGYGPTAPQSESEGEVSELLPNVVIRGEDYLNLNVWTPDTAGRAPVMVFIHGGAFTGGSGAVPVYDGRRFARDGVVLVTINYRLGADGFLWFGRGTPNLGLLDQVAALEWVREEIAGFGGDPDNVTVFGESAGAMSICTLLAMPAASGLFRRAIAESGAGHSAISPASARLVGARLAAILGVEPSREAIAQVPHGRLLAAQRQLAGEVLAKPRRKLWGDVADNLMPFEPVIDGSVLPGLPIDRIVAGDGAHVDLLIGNNSEEALLFLVPNGAIAKMNALVLQLAAAKLRARKAVRLYRANRPKARPGEVYSAMLTDWYYRIPALRAAEAHPRAFVYEFAWRSPAFDGALGACHAIELPFVFDNLADPGCAMLLGAQAPQQLADAMHKAWVDFATGGDPGWPAYRAEDRVVMRFDTVCRTTTDDRSAERAAWDGVR